MKKSKKIVLIIIGILVILGIVAGSVFAVSTYIDANNKKQEKAEKKEKKKDKKDKKKKKKNKNNKVKAENIGFLYVSSNFAWGCYFDGYFVDVDGSVYNFNFSDDPDNISLDRAVTDHDKQSAYSLSDKDMKKLQDKAASIDDDFELEAYDYAMDLGSNSIYAVIFDDNGGYEQVELGSWGDWILVPNDNNAKYICDFFEVGIDEASGKPMGHIGRDGEYEAY